MALTETHAYGNVFGHVWKEGRIGLKLTNDTDYFELLNKSGAGPWKAGSMAISHWVLVPKSFHKNPTETSKWAERAPGQALSADQKSTDKIPIFSIS